MGDVPKDVFAWLEAEAAAKRRTGRNVS
jgi:hypothetical protein